MLSAARARSTISRKGWRTAERGGNHAVAASRTESTVAAGAKQAATAAATAAAASCPTPEWSTLVTSSASSTAWRGFPALSSPTGAMHIADPLETVFPEPAWSGGTPSLITRKYELAGTM